MDNVQSWGAYANLGMWPGRKQYQGNGAGSSRRAPVSFHLSERLLARGIGILTASADRLDGLSKITDEA
ncbi:hypothetical protein Cflav_PD0274 [Pedosphaera parvula Ellin514]|uniref:Uncharacterized protein n=1 Tax=Pedosphaera parvula (strain Ellin514) TaxID=320771 RepID=B9XRX0_PEDPL|nr:hypothetical protein Cflav_PD0274 [Pedosphaera parvula Ellin514]